MTTIRALLTAAAAATILCASAGPSYAQGIGSAFSLDDTQFVTSIMQEARGQVIFAQLAQTRARNATVRQLAAETAAEWSLLDEQLSSVAAAAGMPAPNDLTPAQARVLDELGATYPEDFDAAYVRVAETDFARALEAFGAEAGTRNAGVASIVAGAQPVFERLNAVTDQDAFAMDVLGG